MRIVYKKSLCNQLKLHTCIWLLKLTLYVFTNLEIYAHFCIFKTWSKPHWLIRKESDQKYRYQWGKSNLLFQFGETLWELKWSLIKFPTCLFKFSDTGRVLLSTLKKCLNCNYFSVNKKLLNDEDKILLICNLIRLAFWRKPIKIGVSSTLTKESESRLTFDTFINVFLLACQIHQ